MNYITDGCKSKEKMVASAKRHYRQHLDKDFVVYYNEITKRWVATDAWSWGRIHTYGNNHKNRKPVERYAFNGKRWIKSKF